MRFLKHLLGQLWIPVTLLASTPLFAVGQLPLNLYLQVTGMEQASAPQIIDNDVLFTYAPQRSAGPTRFVGIAFASENFEKVHAFDVNKQGVFFYVLPINPGLRMIEYRLVVDGLWIADPNNPDHTTDRQGIELSELSIPPSEAPVVSSPIIENGGMVQFILKAPPDHSITVAGDFNHWDPFMDPMTEIRPGVYAVTLRIPPGTHAYYYIDGGTALPDPLDPHAGSGPNGTTVSLFTVP